ncbi:MAG: CBS domain-containing protein [Bdellovibrionales bacterium]
MPISDLCSQKLISVERTATLQHAARLMKKYHVGGVVVVESNGKNKPVGILTDRDIVLGVVAENLPHTTLVEDVMSKNVVQVTKSEGISSVIDKMEREGVRRIIVTDDAGNAFGLVSSDDVLQLIAQEMNGLDRLVQRQVQNEKFNRQERKERFDRTFAAIDRKHLMT